MSLYIDNIIIRILLNMTGMLQLYIDNIIIRILFWSEYGRNASIGPYTLII